MKTVGGGGGGGAAQAGARLAHTSRLTSPPTAAPPHLRAPAAILAVGERAWVRGALRHPRIGCLDWELPYVSPARDDVTKLSQRRPRFAGSRCRAAMVEALHTGGWLLWLAFCSHRCLHRVAMIMRLGRGAGHADLPRFYRTHTHTQRVRRWLRAARV
eukprot:COSAG01_NODE_584_length_15174_cov_27.387901_21_plen_158_part_00